MDDLKQKEIDTIVESKVAVPDDVFDKEEVKQVMDDKPLEDRAALIVSELHDKGMLKKVMEDPLIKERILKQAEKTIDSEINVIGNKGKKKERESSFDLNREACENYGVPETVPQWQQKMMVWGSSFWFIIYFLFASVTIAPISTFNRGLKTFFKKNWITIPISILCYLLIIGMPILVAYLRNKI